VAEKDATGRVEAARQDAAGILKQAQAEAHRLSARADRRIQLLHRCQRDGVRDAGEGLTQAFEEERRMGQRVETEGDVAAVSAKLARKLIGLTSG